MDKWCTFFQCLLPPRIAHVKRTVVPYAVRNKKPGAHMRKFRCDTHKTGDLLQYISLFFSENTQPQLHSNVSPFHTHPRVTLKLQLELSINHSIVMHNIVLHYLLTCQIKLLTLFFDFTVLWHISNWFLAAEAGDANLFKRILKRLKNICPLI